MFVFDLLSNRESINYKDARFGCFFVPSWFLDLSRLNEIVESIHVTLELK